MENRNVYFITKLTNRHFNIVQTLPVLYISYEKHGQTEMLRL